MENTKVMKIGRVLKELGVSPKLIGYNYILAAIDFQMQDPKWCRGITRKLYPEIARIYETTPIRVERCIRHAVESGWQRGNIEFYQEIFGHTMNLNAGKPSNMEFICTVADYLNLNLH